MTRSLADARRLVAKVGSKSLVGGERTRFADLAAQVAELGREGRQIVLVSSGAIALGRSALGFDKRPTDMALLQACAAVGQSQLMREWESAFRAHGLGVAQILLTHDDLSDRERYLNARGAVAALAELGVVPIVNENDTVAVDEIRFGDNDQLAAMVATLVGADLLVLLTDVEGVLDERGQRIPTLRSDLVLASRPAPTSGLGTGGMVSKIEAARRCSRRGVPAVIADARDPETLLRVVRGEDVGSLFLPEGPRLSSRKHWIAYTLRPLGALVLDAGAISALRSGASLLPAGIVGVRGEFAPGDAVTLHDPTGTEIGRGLARYGTRDVAKLAGANTRDIQALVGFAGADEVVHRDDLVVFEPR